MHGLVQSLLLPYSYTLCVGIETIQTLVNIVSLLKSAHDNSASKINTA